MVLSNRSVKLIGMRKSIIGLILAILLAGGTIGGYKIVKDNQASVFEDSVHVVIRVIDGDTIDIDSDVRIRLLGIDSSERDSSYF